MTKKALFVSFLSLMSISLSFSQAIDKEKLNAYFKALEDNNKFMGSVAVLRNGEVIYANAIGYADAEAGAKANTNTKYRIGSISKTFTAALTLKAVEEKKIGLDQKLSQYYPAIKNADKITIEHLLYHRSGLHSFTDDEDYQSWNTKPKTEKELIDLIAKGESNFEPGSKFEYSNPNFILLSFILQKAYKKDYAELLLKKIIEPAGLKNTYYGGKINPKNNECYSYNFTDKWTKESETDMSIPAGAGAVVSTPSDLVKFADALFRGKIISASSVELMKTLKDNFGMGLFPLPFHEHTSMGHTGGIDGFTSMFSYFSDSGVAFALTSNGSVYNNNDIAIAVLSATFGKPYDIPEFKTIQLTSADLDKYLGTYATTSLPLKLAITKEDNRLIAQATGQQALPLDAADKDIFTFERAGIVMEFNPAEQTLLLKQGGGEFLFKKE